MKESVLNKHGCRLRDLHLHYVYMGDLGRVWARHKARIDNPE